MITAEQQTRLKKSVLHYVEMSSTAAWKGALEEEATADEIKAGMALVKILMGAAKEEMDETIASCRLDAIHKEILLGLVFAITVAFDDACTLPSSGEELAENLKSLIAAKMNFDSFLHFLGN